MKKYSRIYKIIEDELIPISYKDLEELECQGFDDQLHKTYKINDLNNLGLVTIETCFHYMNASPDLTSIEVYRTRLIISQLETFQTLFGVTTVPQDYHENGFIDVGLGTFNSLEKALDFHEENKSKFETRLTKIKDKL